MKPLLTLILLLLPFQLLGFGAYSLLAKKDLRRARRAGILVPPGSFFTIFFILFVWQYFHPGMLMLGDGAINLFILIVGVAGTLLQFAIGAILYSVLYRSKSAAGR
jgi:hypothetical protein